MASTDAIASKLASMCLRDNNRAISASGSLLSICREVRRPGRFRRFFVPVRPRLSPFALASVRVVRGVEEGAEKTETLTDGVVAGAEVTIGSPRVSRRRHLDPRWSRRSPLRLFLQRCVAAAASHPAQSRRPWSGGLALLPDGPRPEFRGRCGLW